MAAIYGHLIDPGATKVLGIAGAKLTDLSDVLASGNRVL
jgi:hypothetical protein